jgi:hypothetical protein
MMSVKCSCKNQIPDQKFENDIFWVLQIRRFFLNHFGGLKSDFSPDFWINIFNLQKRFLKLNFFN